MNSYWRFQVCCLSYNTLHWPYTAMCTLRWSYLLLDGSKGNLFNTCVVLERPLIFQAILCFSGTYSKTDLHLIKTLQTSLHWVRPTNVQIRGCWWVFWLTSLHICLIPWQVSDTVQPSCNDIASLLESSLYVYSCCIFVIYSFSHLYFCCNFVVNCSPNLTGCLRDLCTGLFGLPVAAQCLHHLHPVIQWRRYSEWRTA